MIKILQVTDSHILPSPDQELIGIKTEKYFRQVLDYAFQHHGPFDQILLTGDLAQDPCRESYQNIAQILHKYDTHCLCLPGNHDDFGLMRSVFKDDLINCNKQKQIENWQLLCLNSQKPGCPGGYLAEEELDFIDGKLTESAELYTLIAMHHHCISSDSVWMDTMITENKDALFEVLKRHPQVKGIIFGHVHQVIEKHQQNIAIYSSPASCFQFKPGCEEFALDNKPPGFRVLELYEDGAINSQVYWLPIKLNELNFNSIGY